MQLNPTCIRDILITVESHSDFHTCTHYKVEDPFPELSGHSHEEILYHIRQCEESGLIQDVHFYDNGKHTDIADLTPAGHDFWQTSVMTPFGRKYFLKELGLL